MPPFALRGIDHIVLRSADPARLIAFYLEVVGCVLEHEQPKLGLTHLRAGGQLIDIVDANGPLKKDGDEPVWQPGRNLEHFCLRIEPFDEPALLAHLAQAGLTPEPARSRFGNEGEGPSLYFPDPDGNIIEFKGGVEPPGEFKGGA